MSAYNIGISRDALRALHKLDKPIRRRVMAAIEALPLDPRPWGMKTLRGVAAYRIRVGDYRVIYTVDDGRLVVLVVVGHRREIYDDL
ncbi:MAG: type II toxin-antitoxin system RelE/ParE family toxin [Actinomycetota bacterium]|nr:type II toxin-antitoxin system RelE/ParE family toxin [Actinomycetota bacterium]